MQTLFGDEYAISGKPWDDLHMSMSRLEIIVNELILKVSVTKPKLTLQEINHDNMDNEVNSIICN
jgi:hypothetical protein